MTKGHPSWHIAMCHDVGAPNIAHKTYINLILPAKQVAVTPQNLPVSTYIPECDGPSQSKGAMLWHHAAAAKAAAAAAVRCCSATSPTHVRAAAGHTLFVPRLPARPHSPFFREGSSVHDFHDSCSIMVLSHNLTNHCVAIPFPKREVP